MLIELREMNNLHSSNLHFFESCVVQIMSAAFSQLFHVRTSPGPATARDG